MRLIPQITRLHDEQANDVAMRILYWVERFLPSLGGVELLSARLLPELETLGHEITVITSSLKEQGVDRWDYGRIPVFAFPFYRSVQKRDVRRIATTLRDVKECIDDMRPNLVHVNFTGADIFFQLHTTQTMGLASIFTIHPILSAIPHVQSSTDSLLHRALNSSDWIVTVSQHQLDEMRELFPHTRSKSSAILNGLPMPSLKASPISFDPPRLLCIGRMDHQKGFDLAIRAFRTILSYHARARLVIAGDGAERGELERLATSLGLAGHVDFLGWTAPEDVPGLINDATLMIVPSRWPETFPLVAMEGALMARPIVATQVGGLPEIVVDGETGRLVPPNDAEALAEAIIELLADSASAVRMGAAARRRAEDRFNMSRVATEYDALYRRLAG